MEKEGRLVVLPCWVGFGWILLSQASSRLYDNVSTDTEPYGTVSYRPGGQEGPTGINKEQ